MPNRNRTIGCQPHRSGIQPHSMSQYLFRGINLPKSIFIPSIRPLISLLMWNFTTSQANVWGKKEKALNIISPSADFKYLNIKEICRELEISIASEDICARIITRTVGSNRLPARVKLAIDIGCGAKELPCNICANVHPFNPAFEGKPSTFRWAPILADQPESSLWIMNSAPNVDFRRHAELHLTFFREDDTATIMRELTLPPHGFLVIRPNTDPELKAFFGGKIGWCTVTTTNPYATTYYFAINPSGVVGGDHGF